MANHKPSSLTANEVAELIRERNDARVQSATLSERIYTIGLERNAARSELEATRHALADERQENSRLWKEAQALKALGEIYKRWANVAIMLWAGYGLIVGIDLVLKYFGY